MNLLFFAATSAHSTAFRYAEGNIKHQTADFVAPIKKGNLPGQLALIPPSIRITPNRRTILLAVSLKPSDESQQGDVAILRLLAAAEIIEADLWLQYAYFGVLRAAHKTTTSWPFSFWMAMLPITSIAILSVR
jgi:hypothetical protein